MKPGDIIRITRGNEPYYQVGDLAKLITQDSDGDWWASFTNMGNAEVHYDGYWNVSMAKFEVIDE